MYSTVVNDIDKSGWEAGPWSDEPDHIVWSDASTQYLCVIRRNHFGALCGYVAVHEGHPWHGKDYDDIQADVHGGLTYSDSQASVREANHGPGVTESLTGFTESLTGITVPDSLWWVGFDCGHGFDISPRLEAVYASTGFKSVRFAYGAEYRTVAYIREDMHVAGMAGTRGCGRPEDHGNVRRG